MAWKFVRVDWVDACSNSGWHSPEKPTDLAKIVSFGYLVKEDKDKVVLAASLDLRMDGIGDSIAIPKGCITRIRTLKVPALSPVLNVED
jgi:hypothetical protein